MKRKELDYELRRAKKEQYFESVKHAQSVAIDEIPLPQLPTEGGDGPTAPTASVPHRAPVLLTNVPVPSFLQQQQQGILKKPSVELQPKLGERDKRDPPGCPPGPPPTLVLLRELDDEWEEGLASQRSKLRFSDEVLAKDEEEVSAQKRQAILAGKNIDDLMREVEHDQRKQKGRLHRSDEEDSDQDSTMDPEEHGHSDRSNQSESEADDDDDDEEDDRDILRRHTATLPPLNPAPPPALSATLPPTLPPQVKLPPGPPHKHLVVPPPPPMALLSGSGYHPPQPPPLRPALSSMPPRLPGHRPGMPPGPPPPRMGMRMPPGPPPGMPLRMRHQHSHHHGGHTGGYQQQHHHHQQQQQHGNKEPKSVTITAKPQIRNLSADVTRFVPSTLRSKREEKGPQKPRHMMLPSLVKRPAAPQAPGEGANKGKTKDDAYMQFMREMQGLL